MSILPVPAIGWQVPAGGAGSQDPEHRVEKQAVVPGRSALLASVPRQQEQGTRSRISVTSSGEATGRHSLLSLIRRKEQLNRRPRKLDGEGEAHLTALACSQPPDGRAGWTLHLLADRLVEREIVDSISPETVRRCLKKTASCLG